MPKIPPPPTLFNRLIQLLPTADQRRLTAHLQPFPLVAKHLIYKVGAPIDFVVFPLVGVVSAMTMMQDGDAIEVATIGNEGMTGLNAFAGGETSPYEVIVQVPGDGLRMSVGVLKAEVARGGDLYRLLALYNTAFATQVSYSVACNGLHKIEQRCCRWLLMTADRVHSNRLRLTHEFLAIMLGVRRPSVTDVLRPLQERGLIRNGRGEIEILNRAGLEAISCECYGAVRNVFHNLFGHSETRTH